MQFQTLSKAFGLVPIWYYKVKVLSSPKLELNY